MTIEAYEPTDRRPITSRERKVWQRVAGHLVDHNISPNLISVLGMISGISSGLFLAGTKSVERGWTECALWLAAAATMQLRLLANMLDGMVAIASGKASRLGELYNELPDRLSDMTIIIGAGYALGGSPVLGYVAACMAILTAYVRAVGKSVGASNLFVGPMAKPQRMFVLTVVALLMTVVPRSWQPSWGERHASFAALGLGLIIVGSGITILERLAIIVSHLNGQK